ncbi:MAG: acyl-CoA/acyl-ACP dehydrogenase [Actinomycetota bacterium]|nr:acyl-CoA/acyl-ACP dehydrogenase [Actinomycetota bacterium]
MHFALTDEQRALQDAVRSYLRDRFGPTRVREVYEDPDGDAVPPALWQAVGEQGWLGLLVPEEQDGFGAGLVEAAVVARAFGAGTVPGPWLGTVLAGEALRLGGSPEQQAAWLPRLAAGEVKAAVALLRPGYSPVPGGAGAEAVEDRLTGTLDLVEYAGVADLLVVAATEQSADGDGVGLFLVRPGEGVEVAPLEALDRTTRLTTVVLRGGAGERLPGATPEVHQELLDRAAVLVANDLVGIARRALTDTVEYDKTRVQFGRPVGSFQAIKHALADLHVGVTMAEHAALYAAYALDTGRPDARLAASIAKAKAGDVARRATSDMIQYHGGIGYTWEHHAHFAFKRAKRLEYAYGDAAQHRERIAQLLVDGAAHDEHLGGEGSAVGGSASTTQGSGVPAGAAVGVA